MLWNSHILAYARCLAGKVCGIVQSTWGTSQGEDKLGARDKILHTKVARQACAGCAPGKHSPVDRRPLSKVYQAHGLPPFPRCTLMQRGVRHCCQRGHHKVNTPHKCLGKRTAPAPASASKWPWLRPAAPAHSQMHPRSPHIPPTPPAPKRWRPKSPIPPSPPAPQPQGMQLDNGDTAVVRALFSKGHGRASSEVT